MTAVNGKKIFGAGRFFGIGNTTNPTPARFGLPQDMGVTFKRSTKSLYGENTLPADVGSGETDVTAKITLGTMNPRILTDLYFGTPGSDGQTLEANNESGTVAGSLHQITVTEHADWTEDLGVFDVETGKQMKCVASGPVAGVSYTVALGVYTFAVGDATKVKKLSYLYTDSTAGVTIDLSNQPMGRVGGFNAVMVFPWKNPSMVEEQDILTLVNCISSDHEITTKQGDYGKPTFGFMAACDTTDSLGTFSFAEAA
jgi:hypothetical protein